MLQPFLLFLNTTIYGTRWRLRGHFTVVGQDCNVILQVHTSSINYINLEVKLFYVPFISPVIVSYILMSHILCPIIINIII